MVAKRVICWFSCGAASAVAAKLALSKYPEVEIIYQDTGSEHPDNTRFLADCELWFKQPVKILKSEKYKSIWDVFEKTRYLAGVAGARCTSELKRKVAEAYLNHFEDVEVFGFTLEEAARAEQFKSNNPERILDPILIEHSLTKQDCLAMIDRAGIELPIMYKLGYRNNNCIGCVKGQSGYWNKIRQDFPDVFERMSKVERELNAAINKRYEKGKRIRVFLDELPKNAGNYSQEPDVSCGIYCQIAESSC
jgi:3'-phosphoadenosine 5'-phosphosulfate sulfotransferase (PAPS reductase)/FAD synthetase